MISSAHHLLLFNLFSLALLLLGIPLELRPHDPSPSLSRRFRSRSRLLAKSLLISLAAVLQLLLLLGALVPPAHIWLASRAAALIALLLLLFLTRASHPRAIRSSTTALFFYLAFLLLSALELGSLVSQQGSPPSPQPFLLYPSLSLALHSVRSLLLIPAFILECLGPLQSSPSSPSADPAHEYALLPHQDDQQDCPILYANIFSRLTFGWMTPLMKLGKKQFLTDRDLWKLPPSELTRSLCSRLFQKWTRQLLIHAAVPSRSPSLIRAIASAYGLPYALAAVFKLSQDILQFVQPQLLRRLLAFVESYSTPTPQPVQDGFLIVLGMFGCGLLQTLLLQQYFHRVFLTGIRIRSGLIGVIYQKSLVLSNEEKSGTATGDIVNLMSTDVSRIQDSASNGLILVSGIFQIALAFTSLYSLLGWSMLGGIAVVLLSVPLNIALARVMTRLQKQQMSNKDRRTRVMTEILNNIRSIKLYCWENAFTQRMYSIRNARELVLLRKMGALSSLTMSMWSFIPFLVAFSAFMVYSITASTPLTPALVFPAISLFQLLQFPLSALPMVINQWVEAYVSTMRISKFLTSKELQEEAVIRVDETSGQEHEEHVSLRDGQFSWSSAKPPVISNVNLSVCKGSLVAVVGRVGSGKSSLLSAILGEMYKVSGTVQLRGKVAYAAQTPWLLSATVRENIIFGSAFNEEVYKGVIEACALVDDLSVLKHGDETQVGEKGISLSGGQKARISLARAVYARADVYLLDDPLSAVDAHVARHLFDKVIGPNGLLKAKARVLCTNAIPFCEEADELIMLRHGKIAERGSFAKVLQEGGELKKLIDEFGTKSSQSAQDANPMKPLTNNESLTNRTGSSSVPQGPGCEGLMKKPLAGAQTGKGNLLKSRSKPREQQATGSVKMEVYAQCLKASGLLGCSLYLFAVALQNVLSLLATLWLKSWSSDNQSGSSSNHGLAYYLGIYGALGLAAGVVTWLCGVLLYSICAVRCAKKLHDQMFHRVLRAPMSFFDTTPVGTLLNRFSRDILVIDEVLPRVIFGFCRTLASVVSVVAVVSWTVPPFLLVCIPLLAIYKNIQSYYIATSRELKRIDAVTKSPIFALFGETLNGLATIRAFGEQSRFIAENETKVDLNQEAFFAWIGSNRWLAIRLELIGNMMIASAALLSVYGSAVQHNLGSGLVGVLMSYALSIIQSLNWLVRTATEVETNVVSCERVIEYTGVKQEGPFETPPSRATPPGWPSRGEVSFEGVECRYRDELDLVLKGVSFTTKAGEKIGICGRTGAGKSTITLSLFRLVEKSGGKITIDGVEISGIGLHALRSKISIIPQDPQCFEGSLRDNLDPEGVQTDEELWKVLAQSRLQAHIQTLGGGLESQIDEGGTNLSNGQRQLLCLSRAMLKQSKVIVLDEATSSIDPETDLDIQAVIREEFKDCTILVIAHRLNTILDCDRILVLSNGKVVEFDSPKNLLAVGGTDERDPTTTAASSGGSGSGGPNVNRSDFYHMCKEAGLIS